VYAKGTHVSEQEDAMNFRGNLRGRNGIIIAVVVIVVVIVVVLRLLGVI
jgi:hypothetical protein